MCERDFKDRRSFTCILHSQSACSLYLPELSLLSVSISTEPSSSSFCVSARFCLLVSLGELLFLLGESCRARFESFGEDDSDFSVLRGRFNFELVVVGSEGGAALDFPERGADVVAGMESLPMSPSGWLEGGATSAVVVARVQDLPASNSSWTRVLISITELFVAGILVSSSG